MSIFKETFRKEVRGQLNQRQSLLRSGTIGNKTNSALIYNQSKACVIQATSLVDYVKDIGIELNDGIDATTGLVVNNVGFDGLKGSGLAKRFILRGNTRGGIGEGGAYGNPKAAADGENIDGYGQVPNPGITSLEVETKSAYGSLRQAKLNFVVYNLRQLEIIELLYMRPGYPVVVEWGWSPYINNEGEIVSTVDTVQGFLKSLNNPVDIFDKDINQEDIYNALIKLRKETDGNADGFMGFVTNFGFKARPDGGFDCFSELVSMGEALDSLKITPFKVPGKNNITAEFVVEETDEEIKDPDALKGLILLLLKYAEDLDTDAVGKPGFWNNVDNSSEVSQILLNDIVSKFPPVAQGGQSINNFILRKDQQIESAAINTFINTPFIRWDLVCFLITEYVIPKTESGKSTIILTPNRLIPVGDVIISDNLKYVNFLNGDNKSQLDISCDPQVCILPHMFNDPTLGETLSSEGVVGSFFEGIGDAIETSLAYAARDFRATNFNPFSADAGTDTELLNTTTKFAGENTQNYIGGIFLNLRLLLRAYDSTIRDQEDPDLGAFIKKIWDEVNVACPMHNFILKVDDEYPNQLYIIDLPVDHNEIAGIEGGLFELKVQANDSIVRDYNLEAKIPDALKSTIAVHAQNPSEPQDIDDVTFNAFNRAIKNRFTYNNSEPKEDRTAEEDPVTKLKLDRQKHMNQFVKLRSNYFEFIRGTENGDVSDSKDQIDDLKTSLKQAQTLVMQEYNLEQNETMSSSVIPLEFNVTLDGISGIVIGNVFKIDESRLPKAYQENKGSNNGGANVGFIVFTEKQSIGSNNDWTTDISGKMIILPGENFGKETPDSNNFDEGEPIFFDDTLSGNEDFEITTEQANIDDDLDSTAVGDLIYVKLNGVFDNEGNPILLDENERPQGYTYVRTSPEIDNDTGFWDIDDNVIGAIPPGNKGLELGKVKEIIPQTITGVGGEPRDVLWYRFRMSREARKVFQLGFTNKGANKGDGANDSIWTDRKQGYVRIDTVQSKP